MNPLAVQLYTVREQIKSGLEPVLAAIADAGYGAVEGFDPLSDPEGFKALADELGLAICSTHAPLLGDQQDAVLAAAKILDTSTVVVPMISPDRWADADGIAGIAADLNDAAAKAADAGIRVGYHNHWFELETTIDGSFGLEVLADALDPSVVLEVDTYWAQVGGADVVPLVQRLGDRVRYLHVKDGPARKGEPMVAVGAGVLPVTEILHANPAVEWHVVELDECATDMIQALRDSATYLAKDGVRS
ncbi:MAG: sugar phosphate isomerase/epimerase family protein [Mycobacteriales bacterium]